MEVQVVLKEGDSRQKQFNASAVQTVCMVIILQRSCQFTKPGWCDTPGLQDLKIIASRAAKTTHKNQPE
jgi:hypothetical protein